MARSLTSFLGHNEITSQYAPYLDPTFFVIGTDSHVKAVNQARLHAQSLGFTVRDCETHHHRPGFIEVRFRDPSAFPKPQYQLDPALCRRDPHLRHLVKDSLPVHLL